MAERLEEYSEKIIYEFYVCSYLLAMKNEINKYIFIISKSKRFRMLKTFGNRNTLI